MSIKEELRPTYRVICDECGRLGPRRLYEVMARAVAAAAHWYVVVEGPLWLDVDYCPDCHEKRERAQAGGG